MKTPITMLAALRMQAQAIELEIQYQVREQGAYAMEAWRPWQSYYNQITHQIDVLEQALGLESSLYKIN